MHICISKQHENGLCKYCWLTVYWNIHNVPSFAGEKKERKASKNEIKKERQLTIHTKGL